MAYAAYLRIYEPVSAFHEPDRSRWAAYAASSTRPRRRNSLAVEHAEALRRAITTPWVAVPEQESEHAYVRRVDGTTYVCPWQTRLRCLLAYGQMRSGSGALLACEGSAGERLAAEGSVGEGSAGEKLAGEGLAADGDPALAALARLGEAGPARPHIVASSWTVPLTWFVPFAPAERWLSLGDGRGRASAAATASGTWSRGAPGRVPAGPAATCWSSAAASGGVNRSSPARSSVSCPRARSRARAKGGSLRLVRASWRPGGR